MNLESIILPTLPKHEGNVSPPIDYQTFVPKKY